MNPVPSFDYLIYVKCLLWTVTIALFTAVALLSIIRGAIWIFNPPYTMDNENVAIALAYFVTAIALMVFIKCIDRTFCRHGFCQRDRE